MPLEVSRNAQHLRAYPALEWEIDEARHFVVFLHQHGEPTLRAHGVTEWDALVELAALIIANEPVAPTDDFANEPFEGF